MRPRHSESEGFKKASRDIAKLFNSEKKLPAIKSAGKNSVPAWFLGTKGENADELERLIVEAIRDRAFWRRKYHPEDPTHITEQGVSEEIGSFLQYALSRAYELGCDDASNIGVLCDDAL